MTPDVLLPIAANRAAPPRGGDASDVAADVETPVRRLRVEIAPKTIAMLFGVVTGVWLLGQLVTVLSVVIVALVLVGTFDPVVARLERRGIHRGRALVLVFAVVGLGLSAVMLLMVPPIVTQLIDLVATAPVVRERLVLALRDYSWAQPVIAAVQELPIETLGARAAAVMFDYSSQVFEALGYGMATLFLAIYLLADPARSKGLLYSVVPRRRHVKLAKILLELKLIVGGYMRGQLITSLSISAFVFVLLTALDADNALAIALFAGMTDIIPFVGGYIASTPVILAVTPHGGTVTTIVVAVMVLYQEFESRVLIPRVYGRVLRLPPAVILVALLVGGSLAGVLGALLALPIAAGLQMVLKEFRVDLPGEATTDSAAILLDEHANQLYEHLAEGASATEAGVIADDLASIVKKSEADLGAPSPAAAPRAA